MKRREGVKITSAILWRAGACSGFRTKFRKRFPKGVYVTPALCVKFALHPLFQDRWIWAMENLLMSLDTATRQYPYGIKTPFQTRGNHDTIVRNAVMASRFGALLQVPEFRRPGIFK